MKIKKYGHSAIIVEERGTKILVDPGIWSPGIEEEQDLDAICITHEHPDHFSIEYIKTLFANNKNVPIYTNEGVGVQLEENDLPYSLVKEGDKFTVSEISFSIHGKLHALIDKDWPQPLNTGFLFNDRLYHPGDALHNPGKPVEVLAVPIMAPWAKISETLDYIREIKPEMFFPIHEGLLKELGLYEMQAKRVGDAIGSAYELIKEGEEKTI